MSKTAQRQTKRRQRLVYQALRHGVRDEATLAAIGRVPREKFVSESLVNWAFEDRPLPIGDGQTISQPAMVAIMAEAARISPADRVLEIGTGSGYGAAVLRALSDRVVTVERLDSLARSARATLARNGYSDVTVVTGDGTLGWPAEAPYDAIVVTAASPSVPPPLIDQLTVGGRLVIPVGSRHHNQHLMRFTLQKHAADTGERTEDAHDNLVSEKLTAVRFVPLIGTHGFTGDSTRSSTWR